MRIKQIVLAAACVLMAAGSATAAEQKAPIDTILLKEQSILTANSLQVNRT